MESAKVINTPTAESKEKLANVFAGVKVAFILTNPERLSGSNRSLIELLNTLKGTVSIVVISTGPGMLVEYCKQAGIQVEILNNWNNQLTLRLLSKPLSKRRARLVFMLKCFGSSFAVLKLLKRISPKLIHCNDPKATFVVGLPAKILRVKLISHLRGEQTYSGIVAKAYELFSNKIICVSDSLRQGLNDSAKKKTVVVHNGIGREPSHAIGKIASLASLQQQGVLNIFCFASVVPFKGYHHLLRVVAELNKRGYRDTLNFVGVGELIKGYEPYHRLLLSQMLDLQIKNFTFAGWQNYPELFYRCCDISVLSSVSRDELEILGNKIAIKGSEGFPRTHLEAMAFGIPIVSFDVAGVFEQIKDGYNGFIVPQGDWLSMADRLEQLIETPAKRREFGENSRKFVRQVFSSKQAGEKVLNTYKEILNLAESPCERNV